MIHSIDRDSGVFSPSTADKINKKTTALWRNIQGINVPQIDYKEKITVEPFSWVLGLNNDPNYELLDNCFCVGGHFHQVNLSCKFSATFAGGWLKLGEMTTPVLNTIFMPGTDGGWILKVEPQSATIQIMTFTTDPIFIYFYYIT